MKNKILFVILAFLGLYVSAFADLANDVVIKQRNATNTDYNIVNLSATQPITDTFSFRQALLIAGRGDNNIFTQTNVFLGHTAFVESTSFSNLGFKIGPVSPGSIVGYSGDITVKLGGSESFYVVDPSGSLALKADGTKLWSSGALSPSASSVTWSAGVGSPEGLVTATVGSLFSRIDGSTNSTLYVKESGDGIYGWVAK